VGGGGRQRRSKTRRAPRRLGHRHGRDAFLLGRGWRREGVTGGVVGAKSNEGAGKNSAGDGGGTLLKWCSGEATEGGGSGAQFGHGAWPRQVCGVPTASPVDRGPTAARASGATLFEQGSAGGH
jgi:hypothetical protein